MSKGKSSSPKPDEGGGDEEGFVSFSLRLNEMFNHINLNHVTLKFILIVSSIFFFFLFTGLGKITNAHHFHCIWLIYCKLRYLWW